MATVNVKTPNPNTTHEGAPARHISVEAELRRSVMACLLWEDSFYEEGRSIAERIGLLVSAMPPDRVAAIAIEARTAMKLRHVPLHLLVTLLRGTPAARRAAGAAIPLVCLRADDMTELLALYWKDGRVKLASQLKRGLAAAFPRFTAYQLAKYDRDGAVRLRDVLFLTHAKPKDAEQAATWKQLVDGTLSAPDTWEVALSAGADKRATWERLIGERKLGALALLRNLRNMAMAGVPESTMIAALDTMATDRVLPFRFVAAARHAPPTLEAALERAMLRALGEQERLPGRTVIVVDKSGSMDDALSAKSDLSRFEAAAALAILLREVVSEAVVVAFGTNPCLVPARRGFALRDALFSAPVGGGTNTEQAKALADAQGYERIVIITDEQSAQPISNPKGKGYVVNVAAYQRGIGYGAWTHIDGWSEAVVDYIRQSEALR